ncbi:MAG: urease accessory protein UreF [Synechococcaceae cyanobacterium RL_1_2]|nr:urease accessory protein UreF [Synechococcaceae cyanobacterium RL_1_2]
MTINYQAFLRLLQLSSPTLPLGAYSYSEGLEWLVMAHIQDAIALQHWLTMELTYGAIRTEAAVMARAYRYHQDLERLTYWNDWLIASKETKELRLQTNQMGKSLIRLLVQLSDRDPHHYPNYFEQLQDHLEDGCSYPIAFGVAAAQWQIDLDLALPAYLHSWANNLVNGGVKLIPLGQTAGQQILWQLNPIIEAQAPMLLGLEDDQLYSCTMGSSLASMNHEQQYTRLFRS